MLEIIPDSAVSVGVDIRRELISAIIIDLEARFIAKETRIVRGRNGKEDILDLITQCIDTVLLKKPNRARLLGIGIGAPGPLNSHEGRVLDPPDFGGFRNFDIVSWIEGKYNLRAFLALGSAAAAMGEYCFRRSHNENYRVVIFVEIDLGIGFGMIVNGNLIQGDGKHAAGEIGHMVIQKGGRKCSCGRNGCLYQYASGMAVLHEIAKIEAINSSESNMILNEAHNHGRKLIEVVGSALEGKEEYRLIFKKAAEYLSIGLMNIDNLLSPSLLVIGSSINGLNNIYLEYIVRWMEENSLFVQDLNRRIQLASYGLDSIAAGAAHIVLEDFFGDPKKYLVN
jgi:glucokinase